MPTLTATTTVTTEIKIKPVLKAQLMVQLRRYQEQKAILDQAKAEMELINAKVEALREKTGETGFALEGFKIKRVHGQRSVLNKMKLISLGCAVSWLDEATEILPSKPYTLITLPSSKSADDDAA